MPSDDRHTDEEWIDERAQCADCDGPVTIRVRRFAVNLNARYFSARCMKEPTHQISAATYELLAHLRNVLA